VLAHRGRLVIYPWGATPLNPRDSGHPCALRTGSSRSSVSENEAVTESSAGPALSVAETQAAEALLTRAWGEKTEVRAAETIWRRSHVVRLHLAAERSVVLKRRGDQNHGRRARGFGVELAALEYLSAMPVPIAPRLLGSDTQAGILLMEDLPPGGSLADSLLTGQRGRAQADLVAYAQALGSLHVWSMGRGGELADLQARYAPGAEVSQRLVGAIERGRESFLAVAATLGLSVGGVGGEIDELGPMLNEPGYLGLVHGDACPDNVRLLDGGCRIFDFEFSSWGPVVLDAAYLLAPFPSCWCFATLPNDVTAPAVDAYRACLQAAGVDMGRYWDAATTAALAGWIVARGGVLAKALEEDHEWGTTTMRPRLLAWLRNFIDQADGIGVLPRLRVLAGALHDQLSLRWPGLLIPDYPAFAQPGSALAQVPEWWQPGL
jgi:Phosphotransferase enzyme family